VPFPLSLCRTDPPSVTPVLSAPLPPRDSGPRVPTVIPRLGLRSALPLSLYRTDPLSVTPVPSVPLPRESGPTAPPVLPRPSRVPQPPRHRRKPLEYFDVFVDDAIGCAQGSHARLGRVRRILLVALDAVLRPLDSSDPSTRQEPASVKKMLKGDACWSTLKVVLGWLIDTLRGTIELPPHRLERVQELFDLFKGRRRVAVKQWHQLLGELRSMTLAIPGGTGLFSHLQEALRMNDRSRVKLTQAVHDQLADFESLTRSLGDRPTRIAEIVPTEPTHVGACDAARSGTGDDCSV
jgi:hypothetical protein